MSRIRFVVLYSGCSCQSSSRRKFVGTSATATLLLNFYKGANIFLENILYRIRDFIAKQMSTVCKDVECEPPLQTQDGETFSANATLTGDNAHPDIRARGFYRPGQNSYFDIKFLNPNSESYLSSSTEKIYERAETQKRRNYITREF